MLQHLPNETEWNGSQISFCPVPGNGHDQIFQPFECRQIHVSIFWAMVAMRYVKDAIADPIVFSHLFIQPVAWFIKQQVDSNVESSLMKLHAEITKIDKTEVAPQGSRMSSDARKKCKNRLEREWSWDQKSKIENRLSELSQLPKRSNRVTPVTQKHDHLGAEIKIFNRSYRQGALNFQH